MVTHDAFGAEYKRRRKELGKTLRAFCREHGIDHGNLSKIERGVLAPPTGLRLDEYLEFIGITRESDEWYELHDLASVCAGKIPEHLMEDEELVAKLPALFKTLNRMRPTEEQLDRLIETIRNA